MTLFLSPSVTTEVTIMWIKTKTGVILNTDHVMVVFYNHIENKTFALTKRDRYLISDGDCTDRFCDSVNRGSKFMEVR